MEIYDPIILTPAILTFPWQPKEGAYQYSIKVPDSVHFFHQTSTSNSRSRVLLNLFHFSQIELHFFPKLLLFFLFRFCTVIFFPNSVIIRYIFSKFRFFLFTFFQIPFFFSLHFFHITFFSVYVFPNSVFSIYFFSNSVFVFLF